MKKIFIFINSGKGTDWIDGRALSEDGVLLTGHISSTYEFFRHDMGITSDWKHEKYKAYYPEGYELVEVHDPQNHPEFKAVKDAAEKRISLPEAVQK